MLGDVQGRAVSVTWSIAAWLGLIAAGSCDRSTERAREARTQTQRVTAVRAGAGEEVQPRGPASQGAVVPGPGREVHARPGKEPGYAQGPEALYGMPPIDLGARDRAQVDLSRRLERRGLKRMREERFEAATDRFFEAIEVDPGNVGARYNFACALSRLGDWRAAVALLDELRDEACSSCLGKVLKARRDADFDPIRKQKAFASAVADVERQLVEPPQAAAQIQGWIPGGKKIPAPAAIDPRRKISVRVGCPTCASGKPEVTTVRGPKALRAWLERKRRAFAGGIAQAVELECKGKCCTFGEPDRATVSPDVLFVAKLCFRLEGGRVTSLSKLALDRYPASGVWPGAPGGPTQ